MMKKSIIYWIALILIGCSEKGNNDLNITPKCYITYPQSGEIFAPESDIDLLFQAEDEDGIIKNIKILIDDEIIINSDTIFDNYVLETNNLEEGCHSILLIVQDNNGAESSWQVTILIDPLIFEGNSGTFIDSRDCKVYEWVKIGEQIWMSENLNYSSDTCYSYNDDQRNSEIYGKLYTWYTACNACPSGWHLPSDNEWKELELYLGMDSLQLDSGFRSSEVTCKIKAIDTIYWNAPNYCATNESGFTAIPAGYRSDPIISSNPYHALGNDALFWTSTRGGEVTDGVNVIAYFAIHRRVGYSSNRIDRMSKDTENGLSVRCVKDN